MIAIIIALALGLASPVGLAVTPLTGFAPLSVRLRITVSPHEDNRSLCVEATNRETLSGRVSCWPLNGIAAPITHFREFRDLPAGEYDIVATVARIHSSLTSWSVPVAVIAR